MSFFQNMYDPISQYLLLMEILQVEIVPCNKKGKEYSEKDDVFVDSPKDLIGQELHFNVKIDEAKGLNSMFSVSLFPFTSSFD